MPVGISASHEPRPSELDRIYARALQPYDGALAASLLMAEAEQATGLRDWGGERWAEEGFRERFDALCHALETEAKLTPIGRSRAHGRVHAMLCSRLRTVDYHTGFTDEPRIVAPFIGTGQGRAGTSFLQALLAQDPENLVPVTGHAMVPIPPPGVLADEAERMDLVARMLSFQGLDAPEVNAIHPFAPDAEDEDVLFQEAACGSLYQGFFVVPSYAPVVRRGISDLYEWQKGLMQIVQSGQSATRWVLKAPEYMDRLDAILAVFPDGRVFMNHRDPAKVIPSLASLHVTFQGLNCKSEIPLQHLGPPLLRALAASTKTMMAWRDAHPERPIVDVRYKALSADPIAEAERVYAGFGLTLTPAARARMETFLKSRNRHGQSQAGIRHNYALEDFGLTDAMIDEACGDYFERFGVERER